jgi:hypothetical protein
MICGSIVGTVERARRRTSIYHTPIVINMLSSLLRRTTYMALWLATTTMIVQAQEAFDEAACLQCVGTLSDWIDTNDFNGTASTTTNSYDIYCDQGSGEYFCLTNAASTNDCPGTSYSSDWECRDDLGDAVWGLARGVFIVVIIIMCCCCTAIVAGIAACIYCCVKGSSSSPLPAGVPGAYQTNPALQQQAQQAMQVLPGTLQMTSVTPTTNTIPAETGLATTAYQPAYQPGYQPQQQQYQPQQYQPSQQQPADIPFAQALSINPDGTPTQKY